MSSYATVESIVINTWTLLLSMLNVYCSVTYYVGDDDVEDDDVEDDDIYLTIRPSNLKHSTYLQKLE